MNVRCVFDDDVHIFCRDRVAVDHGILRVTERAVEGQKRIEARPVKIRERNGRSAGRYTDLDAVFLQTAECFYGPFRNDFSLHIDQCAVNVEKDDLDVIAHTMSSLFI